MSVKNNDKSSKYFSWNNGIGLVGMVAIIAAFYQIRSEQVSIEDREQQQVEQRDQEVATRVAAEIAARDTAKKAAKGAAFADCWPHGTCEGFTQLPVDDEQNSRIERIEEAINKHHLFDREHCQAHRDAGEKWHDCSKL